MYITYLKELKNRNSRSYSQISGDNGSPQLCYHTTREWGRKAKLQELGYVSPSSPCWSLSTHASPFDITSHFWAQKVASSTEATHELLENYSHLNSYNLTSFALKHLINLSVDTKRLLYHTSSIHFKKSICKLDEF